MAVIVAVEVAVAVAVELLTVAPETGKPLKEAAWPLGTEEPTAPVALNW